MANYANQVQIKMTEFEKIQHTENNGCRFILSIDFKWEAAAMRNLNGNAYKVWRYFLRWYGKEQVLYYSPAAIAKELGLGVNGAKSARDELERKGYLTPAQDKKNYYYFTPVLPVDYENLKGVKDLRDEYHDFRGNE